MFLFFFKQKTAYELRISDWSSDVCSSDLATSIGSTGIGALAIAPYRKSSSKRSLAIPAPRSAVSPDAIQSPAATILFWVSVPDLSVQRTVAAPLDSIAAAPRVGRAEVRPVGPEGVVSWVVSMGRTAKKNT